MNINDSPYIYNELISEVFNIDGGNSNLTEEFIYHNQPESDLSKIPIFSSSTLESTKMGYIKKDNSIKSKLKIFNGPCILIARNGYAGSMQIIPEIEFTINDHAYIIKPKENWYDKINLHWFKYKYQELFYNLITSKSDNATFSKEYAEKKEIEIPDIDIQNKIAEKLRKIDLIVIKLEELKKDLLELLEFEIR